MTDRRIGGRCAGSLAAIAAVAFGLGACGGAPPSAAPPTPVASGVLAIQTKEYAFTPVELSIPAGPVHLAISNNGTENHEFEVLAGEASLGKIAAFPRGTTRDLVLTLAPGTYTLICRLNGHDQLGMKGALIVTGG